MSRNRPVLLTGLATFLATWIALLIVGVGATMRYLARRGRER